MKHIFHFWLPLWIIVVAICFAIFSAELSDFGLADNMYGDFPGWMLFSFVTLANAFVIFLVRVCYHIHHILSYYPWLTLLLSGIIVVSSYGSHFSIDNYVIFFNLLFVFLGGYEIFLAYKHYFSSEVTSPGTPRQRPL